MLFTTVVQIRQVNKCYLTDDWDSLLFNFWIYCIEITITYSRVVISECCCCCCCCCYCCEWCNCCHHWCLHLKIFSSRFHGSLGLISHVSMIHWPLVEQDTNFENNISQGYQVWLDIISVSLTCIVLSMWRLSLHTFNMKLKPPLKLN